MTQNKTLSVILRFHDPQRLASLDEALFSIALQTWTEIEVVVALQSDDEALRQQVLELIARQPWLCAPQVQALLVPVAPGVDGRSLLLNEGIRQARGRYLAFLDDDDCIYQHCYATLIAQLEAGGAAVATGGCRVAVTRSVGGYPYIINKNRPYSWGRTREDLFRDNFLPIHSYVIDRARVAAADLWFDETLSMLEDYDFLLRLATKSRFDFTQRGVPVCEYRHHQGNTIQQDEQGATVITPRVREAREVIRQRKEAMTITLPINELVELVQGMPFDTEGVSLNSAEERSRFLLTQLSEQNQLLLTQLTKQNRFLNKLVDRFYQRLYQNPPLLAASVKCLRGLKRMRRMWHKPG